MLRCQIVIIGSSMPGSIMALILARLGYDVVVIDKSAHPRFAIGESSTPTADAYLSRIADEFRIPELKPLASFATTRDQYPHLTVGKKRGFSYFWHKTEVEFQPGRHHENELIVAATPDDESADSHWVRSDVDHQIASWLEKYGVRLLENCEIQSIRPNGKHWRITVQHNKTETEISADYFVDASGRAAVGIRSQNGTLQTSELQCNTSAIFAHFENLEKWSTQYLDSERNDHPFDCDDAAVHHLVSGGWMWQLRFYNGLTSCGFVENRLGSKLYLAGACNSGVAPTGQIEAKNRFQDILVANPSLHSQFQHATITTPSDGFYYRDRLQHLYDSGSGNNWCALPNTIGFVDPLHSKGLAHSLSGVFRLGKRFEQVAPQWPRTNENSELDVAVEQLTRTLREEIIFLDRLISIAYLNMHHFDCFRDSAIWYFAAATNFEHLCCRDGNFDRPFLFFENREFRQALDSYSELLNRRWLENSPTSEWTRQNTMRMLEPFDLIGLFQPEKNNMYANTTAPEGTKRLTSE